jgi:hypothetical protein
VEAIRQGDIPGVQLRRRLALPLAPEEAWRWLVEPEKLTGWLAATASVEGAGSGVVLLIETPAPVPASSPAAGLWRERARTVEWAPPRRWALAWERLGAGWPVATRVVLEVHPAPASAAGGCELDVLHQGFERLPLSVCLTVWESYRRRWRLALERLAAALGEQ